METFSPETIPQFTSHEEEIAFLRSELAKKENTLIEKGIEVKKE